MDLRGILFAYLSQSAILTLFSNPHTMRYIISLLLAIALVASLGFTALISSVEATTTVSGEARITSPVKPRPVIKSISATLKASLLKKKSALLTEIATLKAQIDGYDAAIYDIKAKIDARIKAGITDNADLKAKRNALMKARAQAKKDLAVLLAKLAYIEAKLK